MEQKAVMLRWLFLVVLLSFTGSYLRAQSTGIISGLVMDSSQAVIPGAHVTVRNVRTGVIANDKSNAEGLFRFPALQVGLYELKVAAQGFKTSITGNLDLTVDATIDRIVVLQVGAVTQSIEVQAVASALNTTSANLGEVVPENMVSELPIAGRDFLLLAEVTPGIVVDGGGNYDPSLFNTTGINGGPRGVAAVYSRRGAITVAGNREGSTQYIVDGVPFKDYQWGEPGGYPSIDALDEFKIEKGYFVGRWDGAGVVNVTTKSGTNGIHGTLWYFHRNSYLDARNFFDYSPQRPEWKQHQPGFEVGGPVLKNRLFVLMSYEKVLFNQFSPDLGTVPGTAARSGDFSVPIVPAPGQPLPPTIIDPLTGLQFPGNKLPPGSISTFASTTMSNNLMPAPNFTGVPPYNFYGNSASKRDDANWLGRVDYNISSKDHIFGRYLYSNLANVTGSPFRGQTVEDPLQGKNVALGWTHVFNPNLLLTMHAGLNRVITALSSNVYKDSDPIWANVFKINNVGTSRYCNTPPRLIISGPGGGFYGGYDDCSLDLTNSYYYMGDVNYTKGKHQMVWGATLKPGRLQLNSGSPIPGNFNFTGEFTNSGFADFLLGYPANAQGTSAGTVNVFSRWADFYFEDSIRLKPTFTVDLGVRYQNHPYWHIQNGTSGGNYESRLDLTGTYPGGGYVLGNNVLTNDNRNWAPRIGVAWAPTQIKDFAVRASYGIFYDEIPGDEITWPITGSPSYGGEVGAQAQSRTQPLVIGNLFSPLPPFVPQTYNAELGAEAAAGSPSYAIAFMDDQPKQPYIQTWTFSLQKTLPQKVLFEADYTGSHGLRLSNRTEPDRPEPSATDTRPLSERKPWPTFAFILGQQFNAQSHYNALDLVARRDVGRLTFVSTYTWSHSDDWSSFQGTVSCMPVDDKCNSRSDFDMRHRFTISGIYQLPFLSGQNVFVRQAAGGWQLSLISTIESGVPTMINNGQDFSNTGSIFCLVPDRIKNPDPSGFQKNIDHWFDPTAFVNEPLNTWGNAGRNPIIRPGLIDQDVALSKNFRMKRLGENRRLEVRIESLNVLNHPSFGNVDSVLGDTTFGRINSARLPRDMQVGAKLFF